MITQDAVLGTFDRILGALTLSVAGIAAISLAVAASGDERDAGGDRPTHRRDRPAEGPRRERPHHPPRLPRRSGLLSLGGAAAGILLGHAGAWALRLLYPLLPAWPPDWAVLAGSVPRSSPDFCSGCCLLAALRALDPVCLAKR